MNHKSLTHNRVRRNIPVAMYEAIRLAIIESIKAVAYKQLAGALRNHPETDDHADSAHAESGCMPPPEYCNAARR